jgi:hypothetical protein
MDGDATEMFFGKGDRSKMRERVSHETMAGSARYLLYMLLLAYNQSFVRLLQSSSFLADSNVRFEFLLPELLLHACKS